MKNFLYNELHIGQSQSLTRKLTRKDIQLFAIMSGDVNPAHLDPAYAAGTPFHDVIAHGLWGGALFSTLLGTRMPGPGTIYLEQSLKFMKPVRLGESITARVEVTDKEDKHQLVRLACSCVNQKGETVIQGEALVKAPQQKVDRDLPGLPEYRILERQQFAHILERTRNMEPAVAAIAHPVTAHAMRCVKAALETKLIKPLLFGPLERMHSAAAEAGLDVSRCELVATQHSHESAAMAVAAVVEKRARLLVKGSLHTHEFLQAVLARDAGLRTERRISHIYLFDVPGYDRLLGITDAAINIEPDLNVKADIAQNAIDFAHSIGIEKPRVAILSAVETVNSKMRSTLDAAALCKMADRGQITGGLLDGPLAFDNAISEAAAAVKGIVSEVAGRADILLVPNLETGNAVAKQLEYFADAASAGLLIGAKAPIVLTSRADSPETMAISCGFALLCQDTTA